MRRSAKVVSLGKQWWEQDRAPGDLPEVRKRRTLSTKYYSVKEVAEKFNLGVGVIYNLIQTKELESVLIGGTRRIPHEALEDYLNRPFQKRAR